MNLDIKFRVWSLADKCYLSSVNNRGIEFIIDKNTQQTLPISYFIGNAQFIVQRFSGLTDKNNFEIYEGDILKSIIYPDRKMLVKYGWYRQTESLYLSDGKIHHFNYSHVGFFVEWEEGDDEFETTLAITNNNSIIIGNKLNHEKTIT